MSDSSRLARPEPDQSVSRPRSPRDLHEKSVVFVAPPGTVSRALLCAIEAEFPWLRVEVVGEPEEIAERVGQDIQLIVLAYPQYLESAAVVKDIAGKHREAGFAVMADIPSRSAFPDLPEGLAIRGVLPMNVNLDIWLSILRIMLHGGMYLPAELLIPYVFARGAHQLPETGQADHKRHSSAFRRQPEDDDFEPSGPVPAGGDGPDGPAEETFAEKPERQDGSVAPLAAKHSPLDKLTVRECEVLHMVSRGCQNKIIASELGLAENTVKIHLHNIIRKLAVDNRTQAANVYLEELETGRTCRPETTAHDPRQA